MNKFYFLFICILSIQVNAQTTSSTFDKAFSLIYSIEDSEQNFIKEYYEIYKNCIERKLSTNAAEVSKLKSKSNDLQNNSKKLLDYFNQLRTTDIHFYTKYKIIFDEVIQTSNQLNTNSISLNKEMEKFAQTQCYSINQNCNFEEKFLQAASNLKTIPDIWLFKQYLWLINGLSSNLFISDINADEILKNDGELRKLTNTKVPKPFYFYDEIFSLSDYTFEINFEIPDEFLYQFKTIEIDGKEFLNGYAYLTIKDGWGSRVAELSGRFYKGRIIGDAKLCMLFGGNEYILNSYFWGIPLSKENVIETKWGEYTGDLKFDILPHGKGTLKRDNGKTVCSGEFKDGIPTDVECTTFNFDTGHTKFKIINGKIIY